MEMHLHETPSRARTAELEYEDTARLLAIRRLIMAVAKHKFVRGGYHATLLDDIRRASDLSWDAFRAHFESKGALLEAVLQEGWKEIGRPLAETAFGSPNGRVGMLAPLALMTKVLPDDEDWVWLFLFEGRTPDPESGEIRLANGYCTFHHLCTELVVCGQKDGSFR